MELTTVRTGFPVVLWYYSELYLDRSTTPLAGLIYVLTFPAAVACVACGLVGFLYVRPKRARASATVIEPAAGPS